MLDTVSETGFKVNGNPAREALFALGRQLDDDILLPVGDKGIVMPGDPMSSQFSGNKDVRYERQRKSAGPATGSGQRTKGRERPTDRSANPAPPVVSSNLRKFYQNDVDKVKSAYPGARFSWHKEGFCVKTTSILVTGQARNAVFLTYVPLKNSASCRTWAFWNGNSWIGPRHTNFPDGSVCAFDPRDQTWLIGESLVDLLDLYTLWALRHLHLVLFGRWPGRQSAWHPYERVLEFQDDELCGCDKIPSKQYQDCCKDKDLQRDQIADAVSFTLRFNGGRRNPPDAIYNYFNGSGALPKLDEVFSGTLP